MPKELYYTPETIAKRSRAFINALHLRKPRPEDHFSFDRAALLVLDMQVYFLDPYAHAYVPSAQAILPGIQKLTGMFYANKRPVIFTRHTNNPENAGQMRRWWHDLIRPASPLSQITADLDTSEGIIIEKSQYDAFYETHLQRLLEEKSVRQVVICGVMTHLCCETTARSAFMRGFEVFFTVDGTATYNQNYHQASLLNLAHGFATPILVQEVLKNLNKHET